MTDAKTTWAGLALAFAEIGNGMAEGLTGKHIVHAALYALFGYLAKDGQGLKDPGAR